MSRVIDLDAARAARAEALGEPLVVRFGGEEFTLPAEVPYDYLALLASGDPRAAINALLGEAEAPRFWQQRPSVGDMRVLMEGIEEAAGLKEGEAPASGSSSNGTSRRSRPTSPATTA